MEKALIDHAIVLKNYFPKKNKVTILHARFGKINFYIDEKHQAARLCNGSLMYCQIIKKQSLYQCDFLDVYFIPFLNPLYDLYFIHDILKICLLYMPDQIMMDDIFDLIVWVYQRLEKIEDCEKKIFLLRLFLYLGIFPENKKLYQHVMQDNKLHSHDLDIMLQQGLKYCWNSDINCS